MKMTLRLVFICILFLILTMVTIVYYLFYNNIQRIAHAGGGINGKTYTNSLEAIQLSIKNGFKYIEIDFNIIDESIIVCSHTIDDKYFTYEKFLKLNKKREYHECDLNNLAKILIKNKKIKIITDVKYQNSDFFNVIDRHYFEIKDQLIPQAYSYDDYMQVKEYGYKDIILTLYRYQNYIDIIRDLNKINDLYAITISKNTFYSYYNEIREIHPKTKIYIHTINSLDEYCSLMKLDVFEIYTDFLLPKYNRFYCMVKLK